ncbi:MAG: histidine kinase [Bacteroidetes bacterium]|nr:histidine kinase [Bacteroidota bacterium]
MNCKKASFAKTAFVLVFALVFAYTVQAQNRYVDSLIHWVDTHPTIDSLHILSLHRISYRLSEKDVKRSFAYYEKVSRYSDSLHFTYGRALAQINLGILLSNSANFESSNNAYFTAIELADSCGAPRLKAVAYDDIGENFKALKDYSKCMQYVDKAIPINSKLKAWRGVAVNYELLHECTFEEAAYDNAKKYLLLGLPFANKTNDSYILSQYYNGFGKLYAIEGKTDSALFYFNKATLQARLDNDIRHEYDVYMAKAQYLKSMSLDNKVQLLDSALEIAKRTSYLEGISNASQLLSSIFDQKNEKDSSLFYYRIYRTTSDSLFSEKNQRNVIIKESEWMIKRKELENNDLKQLANLQREEIRIKNRLLVTTIISFLMLILIIYFANYSRQFKKKREEAAFKQKVAETQMRALKAQMNPHFVFNSFNNIENFLLTNGRQSASYYFSKLAAFVNMILDFSNRELIPVSKDKAAIELYIELQLLRYNNKFSFKTNFEKNLLSADCLVPPLLVQPYIENAIVHGLVPSDQKDLELTLKARLENGYVIYTIKDNGIGRQKAAILQNQSPTTKPNDALSLPEERINILNQQNRANGEVHVTDLYDEYGKPSGTKVEVRVKSV